LHSTVQGANRTLSAPTTYGKSQEETPAEDEQAQAQKALEVESPQKAHVAEIGQTRRKSRRVFLLNKGKYLRARQ
jgi:hypothetical protein